jgi:hypothetical protein
MEMVPVESSQLAAVGFDPATRELQIEFKRGTLYRFPGVPPDVHAGLMAAASKGRFFYYRIRWSYRGIKVR